MYKKVPEDLTIARLELVQLIQERKLRSFALEHNFTYVFLYRIAVADQRSVPYKLILQLRDIIDPLKWFYRPDEKMPQKTEYKKTETDFEISDSYALMYLKTIDNLRNWSITNGQPYCTIYNYAHMDIFPSFSSIMRLKKVIKPDLWYIHKKELAGFEPVQVIPAFDEKK